MTIYDLVTSKEISTYWNGVRQNRGPYLGQALFPHKKKLGLDISWIKGSRGVPVALKLSAFDVKATLRDRVGFDKLSAEMPFFKEAMLVNEKDRQELNKVINSGNSDMIESIINNVFDDVTNLVDGAAVQRERMRMQLLSSGIITLASNGQSYTYDYNMLTENKMEVTTAWSDAAADILGDIAAAQTIGEKNYGSKPVRAICTRKTFNYFTKNNVIKASIAVQNSTAFITEKQVKAYLFETFGITVEVYSKLFKTEAGTETPYFPDDVFTLLPAGALGNTWYGTTPEESDLLASGIANVSIVDTGVAITTSKTIDPVNVETKVSQIVLPSFEAADGVVIIDTTAV